MEHTEILLHFAATDAGFTAALPVTVRAQFGDLLHISIGSAGKDAALYVFSDKQWADLTGTYDKLPASKQAMLHAFFANEQCCDISANQLHLEADLAGYAGISGEAVLRYSEALNKWLLLPQTPAEAE